MIVFVLFETAALLFFLPRLKPDFLSEPVRRNERLNGCSLLTGVVLFKAPFSLSNANCLLVVERLFPCMGLLQRVEQQLYIATPAAGEGSVPGTDSVSDTRLQLALPPSRMLGSNGC